MLCLGYILATITKTLSADFNRKAHCTLILKTQRKHTKGIDSLWQKAYPVSLNRILKLCTFIQPQLVWRPGEKNDLKRRRLTFANHRMTTILPTLCCMSSCLLTIKDENRQNYQNSLSHRKHSSLKTLYFVLLPNLEQLTSSAVLISHETEALRVIFTVAVVMAENSVCCLHSRKHSRITSAKCLFVCCEEEAACVSVCRDWNAFPEALFRAKEWRQWTARQQPTSQGMI